MTATERFGIICTLISVVGGAVATTLLYFGKRMFDRYDQLNADRQKLLVQTADDRQAMNDRHAQRNAEAVQALTKTVSENQSKLTALYSEMSDRVGQSAEKLAYIAGKLNVETLSGGKS